MSRRRKKNPLLMKILVISIAAHAVALPILAHFGAFDKLKKEFGESKVVMVTVAPAEQKKQPEKEERKKTKTDPAPKKGPSASDKNTSKSNSNLPQPKVVAAGGDASGSGSGPAVDPNGTGVAGRIPVDPNAKPKPDPSAGTTPPVTNPDPKPVVKPPVDAVAKVDPKPPVEPVKPPVKPKVFRQLEATYSPEPVIPDDLRTEPFEKTLVLEATVDVDGKPSNLKVQESTGTKELDDLGLSTAKTWRFKPATLDGEAVEGKIKLRIVFKVD